MIFKFKDGAHIRGSAQALGEALEQVREQADGLTPAAVVKAAKDEASVLHPCFDWDDATAADQFREVQARELIRSVRIVIGQETEEPVEIRAYVSVTDDEGDRVYESTMIAMADPGRRRQVFERAMRELQAFRRKYSELEDFARVFKEVDRLSGGAKEPELQD